MESRPVAELEARFQSACDSAVETCRSLTPPYIPTTWISMCQRLGAAEAARRLVVSGDIQTGFDRLVQADRPRLRCTQRVVVGVAHSRRTCSPRRVCTPGTVALAVVDAVG